MDEDIDMRIGYSQANKAMNPSAALIDTAIICQLTKLMALLASVDLEDEPEDEDTAGDEVDRVVGLEEVEDAGAGVEVDDDSDDEPVEEAADDSLDSVAGEELGRVVDGAEDGLPDATDEASDPLSDEALDPVEDEALDSVAGDGDEELGSAVDEADEVLEPVSDEVEEALDPVEDAADEALDPVEDADNTLNLEEDDADDAVGISAQKNSMSYLNLHAVDWFWHDSTTAVFSPTPKPHCFIVETSQPSELVK